MILSNLKKSISKKIALVFGIILVTVSTSYFLSFWFNSTLKKQEAKIELARQNNLLIQKMRTFVEGCKYDATNSNKKKCKKEFISALERFESNIHLIKDGGYAKINQSSVTLDKATSESVKNYANQLLFLSKQLNEYFESVASSKEYTQIDYNNLYALISGTKFEHTSNKLFFAIENVSNDSKSAYIRFLVFLLVLNVSLILITLFFVRKNLKPIVSITKTMKRISEGEIPENMHVKGEDEIGQIITAVNSLSENIKQASTFAETIGNGDLETRIEVFGNKGKLSESLELMRKNLSQVAEEEARRNWATEGLAKFVDIVRSTDDIENFYDGILGNLIRYLKANQGYLYIVNDENPSDPYMEIKSVYAYEKKRYLEEEPKIRYKQGLIGQAWFDKAPLYFTEIPSNYVRITSGIGEALPTCILIVPLLHNEEVVGAIEIASFTEFEQYEQEFVSKLAETIAGSVSNVKVSERTKKLLHDSREQEESLRAQEEEIRQNMEEMQATQEEMERAQRAMKHALDTANEKEQEALRLQEEFEQEKNKIQAEFNTQLSIINATAIVSRTDLQGNITYVNDMFCEVAQYTREELIGKPHNIVRHDDMPPAAFEDLWRTISSGKIWTGQVKNKKKDGSYYWVQATISPILGENGKPIEYMAVRYLITDMMEQQMVLNQTLEEVKAQEEELKQNMEELSASQNNMESIQLELSAQLKIINKTAICSKTDLKGNIIYVNDEFVKWSGYTEQELMGNNHRMLRHEDMPAEAFEDLWRTISSGNVWKGQVKNKAKNGSAYWVDATISPIMDENGKPKEYMAVRFVINDLKSAEEEIEKLRKELASLSK
jgi:PAS domain S-box-containing protein